MTIAISGQVNKKPEITSVCCTLHICNKISIRKPLVDISHIQLFWFPFIVSCKQNIYRSQSFSCKASRLAFSFLPSISFEIFTAGFSSRIFIFPPVHWLKKSDYSSIIFDQQHALCQWRALENHWNTFKINSFGHFRLVWKW